MTQDTREAAEGRVVYPVRVNSDTFGQRFKQPRIASGLLASEAADIIGVTEAAVSYYENDRNYPKLTGLIRFAQKTGVSLDWLVLGRPPAGQYEQRIKELPEGLKMWVLESLLLAEQVARSLPAEYLQPPTNSNYMAYSQMLVRMSERLSVPSPSPQATGVDK